jgi:hypothetical protein
VTVDAIRALLGVGEAEHSTIGIVLAALSLVIMPVLSYAQRRAGHELGSLSAVADSKQTQLCTYLSAVLLVGLVLNSLFGWAWADPIADLIIAAIAVREGIEAWKGDTCCPAPVPAAPTTARKCPAANAATTRKACTDEPHYRPGSGGVTGETTTLCPIVEAQRPFPACSGRATIRS